MGVQGCTGEPAMHKITSMGDLVLSFICHVVASLGERCPPIQYPAPNAWAGGRAGLESKEQESRPTPHHLQCLGEQALGRTTKPTLLVEVWVNQPGSCESGRAGPAIHLSCGCGGGRGMPAPLALPLTACAERGPCPMPGQHSSADPIDRVPVNRPRT